MKRRIMVLATVLATVAAQSMFACEVYFTNDLVPASQVTIVDKRNPEKKLELAPGASDVKWGTKDQMAYFTVLTESGSAVMKQIACTPTKEVPLSINNIMAGQVDERYFILNPIDDEPDADCGCSGDAQEE